MWAPSLLSVFDKVYTLQRCDNDLDVGIRSYGGVGGARTGIEDTVACHQALKLRTHLLGALSACPWP
jgi:hypothetical protein